MFEGLTSDIDIYGKQPQSPGIRCDCTRPEPFNFTPMGVNMGVNPISSGSARTPHGACVW